ncbi:thioredoxin fold domain-containing protein [Chitinophaga varians]|uniref:Thioredoxin fold domain-containing protein n=1 Tax=Chitinophaga varians TaxID=2202339 RepID=A0A847RUU1_9BACT|nr:thioredoxin family protein [Chitinophaga varians]NLR66843.1 thioredoxin fold domain-containing protein [Chitinophaga varians]
MKKILILLLTTMPLLAPAQETKINFTDEPSWDKILSMAKSEKKSILLDVYATWCIPCKKMEKEVYTLDSIGEYINRYFISLKIQIDSNKNDNENIKKKYYISKSIKDKFKVTSVPSIIFLDSNGILLHRSLGYMNADQFLSVCRVATNPLTNYAGKRDKFIKNLLSPSELMDYALELNLYHEDSLAQIVTQFYKKNYLNLGNPNDILTPQFPRLLLKYPTLLSSQDKLVRYIYQNPGESDRRVAVKGFSHQLLDYLITRDVVKPKLEGKTRNNRPATKSTWRSIKKEIENTWDIQTADRVIEKNKTIWYTQKKDWKKLIKLKMKTFDDSSFITDSWKAYEVNEFVWNVVFKHSKNVNTLKKASQYMKQITKQYPENHAAIDTYANVLYKLGKKEEALSTEKKALYIAEKSMLNEDANVYKETIKKIELNIPTWQ